MKINLFFIILLILLNLFSLYTYYSILENEREKMAESIQSILSGIDPNNFQDENERRMFAQISGKEKDYEKYIDNQKLENKLDPFLKMNSQYEAIANDYLGNEIKKKSLEIEENSKNNLWNNFLKANDMTEGGFMWQAVKNNKDPEIAKKIVTEKNIEKYKESNPEFFKEITRNGKKELVLLSGWENDRNIYQSANKQLHQGSAENSINFIYENMDDKQKNRLTTIINSNIKNNAMTSGFIQMDKVLRSNTNDEGMIKNFITMYPEEGKELVYKIMTEDPTIGNMKNYMIEHSEMIQKVTGLSGEEFYKQLGAFYRQADKGLKTRGSGLKDQSNMIRVGKKDEKGNFIGTPTKLQLWSAFDDDTDFNVEKENILKEKERLDNILTKMNILYSGLDKERSKDHEFVIDKWMSERNKNK